MIQISNLSKSFGSRQLFSISSLCLPTTGLVVVKGENGSGKTTFLNLLGLLDSQYEGEILFDGRNVRSLKEKEKARIRRDEISYVFQKHNLLSFASVKSNLDVYGPSSEAEEEEYRRRPSTLSQGQQEIIALKRAFSRPKKVYLLDEVFSSLDEANRAELKDRIKALSVHSLVVLVAHDVLLDAQADAVYRFEGGKMVTEKENPEGEVLSSPAPADLVLNSKALRRQHLLHTKTLFLLNFLLSALLLMLGYDGCLGYHSDRLGVALSALKNQPYIALEGKRDQTAEKIRKRFPGRAFLGSVSDGFPLAFSDRVPADGKVHCSQSTLDYYRTSPFRFIRDGQVVTTYRKSFDIVLDDTLAPNLFFRNEPSSSEGFFRSIPASSWNPSFCSSLDFCNETEFKASYPSISLPSPLEDGVLYVFQPELAKERVFFTPPFSRRDPNDYQPDLSRFFPEGVEAKLLTADSTVTKGTVLLSDASAQGLKEDCISHSPVLVSLDGIRFSVAAFLASHRYTFLSAPETRGEAYSRYQDLIQGLCSESGFVAYGMLSVLLFPLTLLVEAGLFAFLLRNRERDIRILLSLGMTRVSLYFLLLLPLLCSLLLALPLGVLLAEAGFFFQATAFFSGSLYTLLLFLLYFLLTGILFQRRVIR